MARRLSTPGDLQARFEARMALAVRRGQSVCAAYSGGLDSTVLLDLLARSRAKVGYALRALHVHHGLSPNADAWARACEAFARRLRVPLEVERVRVARDDPAGTEAAARAARHAAYARAGADFVALAHHRDDQAETVLLQALRGTGVKGLSAMGESRAAGPVTLLRPLLDLPRATLLAYAQARGLAWVDDESNALVDFDRNFVRHEVIPVLARRFPQASESLARLARHAAAATAILDDVGRADLARLAEGDGLSAARLAALGDARGANALRLFLAGHGLAMPGEARLAEMLRQLRHARGDARVLLLHAGCALVRHRGRILLREAPGEGGRWEVAWRGEPHVALGGDRGQVSFSEALGDGIAADRVRGGTWRFAPRAGGERIRLRRGGPSRSLKNLLQENAVPLWERGCLPLLFDGERLVWVPGIGIASDYQATPAAPGLTPSWGRFSGTVPENRPQDLSPKPVPG